MSGMSLWRLERLRLTRTSRLAVIVGLYAFFGALGPVTARYLREILERFGGGVEITMPDPRPVDGIAQYIGNASQLGVLAVVVVAAGALAFDARPEWGAFLRTRLDSLRPLVLAATAVPAAAATLGLGLGTAIAWAMTVPLLGSLPPGEVALGFVLGAVYLAFVVAITAAVAARRASVLSTVLITISILLALPVLALLPQLEPWLPSELLGAPIELLSDVPPSRFLRATIATAALIPLLIAWAVRSLERREV